MPRYSAPLEDVLFVLEDVLDISGHRDLPGFFDLSSETLRAVLGEGARFCAEVLQPLNQTGDAQGCRLAADGTVTTPQGFPSAYAAYREGGWVGLSAPESVGGQNLPATLNAVMQEFVSSANLSFGMVPGLTQGAYAAILAHGTPEQQALSGPPLVEGRWTGTMNLTEPQAGSDVGALTTKAVPNADGSYAITGQKIYITWGDHDLAENIVHLVLARLPGAPAGYDIGSGSFRVRPGYRSGYAFEVGSDYSITLIGRLIDRDGAPIALLAGTAVEAAEPDREPITVFTNRDGRFALAGARPGVWRVTMPTVPPSTYEITVQAGADAIIRLGDLEPK